MAKQALEGVKVADFGWIQVLPTLIKYLADHGAQVVRIESSQRVDALRTAGPFKDDVPGPDRAAHFATFNNNKYGVTLNLKHPKGLEMAKGIVAWADVVAEGFTPGTMDRLGLGYEQLRVIKPDIIMLSTCSLGQTGPYASQPGFGIQLTAFAGFSHLTGWPDREPSIPYGAYTDTIAPPLAAAALIAALDYRRRTGKGQHIDLSQYEAGIQYIAPVILDFSVNGRITNRMGNQCSYAAPHGAYPCRGQDRWCAIAVFSDEEWQSLCQAMGNPAWTKDPRFATLQRRKENEAELDGLIGEWTRGFTAEQLMATLQSRGVAAGVVQTCEDLYNDPQLRYRQHYQELEHPVIGKHYYESPCFKLSRTQAELRMPGPCLGQHNEYVCTQILGMSDQEFTELLADGVFA
ncbi:CaiB/BaiF CoA transferase family protein [Chloroflexota bacterium]